jgi:hypothetical protein
MVAGQRFGLDVETMLEVFNAGTARNFSTVNTLISEAMSRRYGAGFRLALMAKDLRIASSLFERVDFDAPISLTSPDHEANCPTRALPRRAQERRLPNPRLAADEHRTAPPIGEAANHPSSTASSASRSSTRSTRANLRARKLAHR